MIATATGRKLATALVNGDVVAAQDGYTLGVISGAAGLGRIAGDGVACWIDRADRTIDEPHAIVRYSADELVYVFTIEDWQAWEAA